ILLETVGGDDIALLAVGVMQQGDTRRAIGVVLDLSDARRHTVLVIATEVDLPVGPLVPAALMTGGDAALIIAAAILRQWPGERLLRRRARDLGEVRHAGAATTARRGLLFANCHSIRSSTNPSQRCPVGCVSAVSAVAANFGVLKIGRASCREVETCSGVKHAL